MARWTVRSIAAVPTVADGEPGDPAWHPLQHALGIDTFGANVFVADRDGQELVAEHDESGSGQQELYVVLRGSAAFELDGEPVQVGELAALAVTDPTVRRSAIADVAGTMLLIVGAPDGAFKSTWNASHFEGIPRP